MKFSRISNHFPSKERENSSSGGVHHFIPCSLDFFEPTVKVHEGLFNFVNGIMSGQIEISIFWEVDNGELVEVKGDICFGVIMGHNLLGLQNFEIFGKEPKDL